jgi:hypothetical protein
VTIHVLEFEKSRRVMCNVIVQGKFPRDRAGGELMNALRRNFSVRFLRDRLRNAVTTFVVFSGGILISQSCFAGFDLYAGGTLRSYPLAGVMEAESGYGILLRGEANSPFSSYLRPRIYGSTAGIYNSLDAALEFFPLAILGVRAGGDANPNERKNTS